jgi:hypothetical protein
MQKNFRDVLLEILIIVKYPNNKEKFIKEFEELNHMETVANLLDKLSFEVQEKIKANEHNIEEVKKYLPTEEYISELTKVSNQALLNLVSVVTPLLKIDQKQKIAKLVQH